MKSTKNFKHLPREDQEHYKALHKAASMLGASYERGEPTSFKKFSKLLKTLKAKKSTKSEAVDQEERKLRLKKLLDYSNKKRVAGRMAHDQQHKLDRTYHDAHLFGTSANNAMAAKYKLWGQGQRARAIIQKFTGKDYKHDSLDWSGGSTHLGSGKHSWKRRADAHATLRAHHYGKTHRGLVMSPRDKAKVRGRWLNRVRWHDINSQFRTKNHEPSFSQHRLDSYRKGTEP